MTAHPEAFRQMVEALEAVSKKFETRPYGTGSYLTKPLREQVRQAAAIGRSVLDTLLPSAVESAVAVDAQPTKIDRGFRWDGEAQQHIPTLLIEFDPVPANGPCDAKGWQDRNALADALSMRSPS